MGLKDVIIGIGGDTSHYERSMRDIKHTTKKATQAVTTMWMGAAAGIYAAIKVWDRAKMAARAEQEKKSFESLAASYGTNADKIVADLQRASGETIDMMTMINKAGTAMMMGITPESLSKLMEIAKATSRMTGQTVTKSFEDISLAVGRQSKMILDNLGIIVRVEEANKDYAKQMGIVGRELTDAEKKQAFLNATINAGEELIARLGGQNETTSEKVQQIEASIKDLSVTLGSMLIPNLSSWAGWIKNIDTYYSNLIDSMDELTLKNMKNELKRLKKERDEMSGMTGTAIMPGIGMAIKYGEGVGSNKVRGSMKELAELTARINNLETGIKNYGKVKIQEAGSGTPGTTYTIGSEGTEEAKETWYDLEKKQRETIRKVDAELKAYFEDLDQLVPNIDKALGNYFGDLDKVEEEVKNKKKNTAEEQKRIQAELTDRINQYKMSEKVYAIWVLEQETEAYRKTAGENAELQAKITAAYKLSMDEISNKGKQTFGEDLQEAMKGWASGWSNTLNEMLWGADRTFGNILVSFGKMLTQMIIQKKLIEPLFNMMGSWFGAGSSTASAHGNVFAGPGISAYENRIVKKPTLFPFAHGIGLMGEGTKPEAIMPLTRTPGGDLGVKAVGGGGAQNVQYVDMRNSTFLDKETMNQSNEDCCHEGCSGFCGAGYY